MTALALAGIAGCDSDPYLKRPGGYTPGGEAWTGDKSANYTSEAAYERNYKGIHPGSR